MRSLLLIVAFCVFGTPAVRAADDFTVEKAKALIPEAAGLPSAELQKLAAVGTDPEKYHPSNGDSLTWLVLKYRPGADTPKEPTSLKFLSDPVGLLPIFAAIGGSKDKDGKLPKTATLIHPEYITDCTCKVDGDAATGTVTFRAEKAYEGKAEYTARKKEGKWRIEELRLPDLKITSALGADGKWVKK
jgi:hypothetical protein